MTEATAATSRKKNRTTKNGKPRLTRRMVMPDDPLVTIVIPVYNEEKILRTAINSLMMEVSDRFDWDFEVIITENGSTDNTVPIAKELGQRYENLKVLHCPEPNYGKALRQGILAAKGTYVLCDEIDLCDTNFYAEALRILMNDDADFVVGSKLLAEAEDERPVMRRTASWVLNQMLRYGAGFKGTDTHGLKSFQREKLLNVVNACKVDKDIFASEFVIRAERAYVRILEIPISLKEIRPPSIHLFKRVPSALKNIARLSYLMRIKG